MFINMYEFFASLNIPHSFCLSIKIFMYFSQHRYINKVQFNIIVIIIVWLTSVRQ